MIKDKLSQLELDQDKTFPYQEMDKDKTYYEMDKDKSFPYFEMDKDEGIGKIHADNQLNNFNNYRGSEP